MRVLTLLVECDEHPPAWIYTSHLDGVRINGLHIKGICEGNQIVKYSDVFVDDDEGEL